VETRSHLPQRVALAAFGLGVLTFALGLTAFAYFGLFMRPSGDDYCYAAAMNQLGFWRGQVASYMASAPVAYHGDRYSLTLFSYVSSALPPKLYGLVPGATIAAWVAGMAWAIYVAARRLKTQRTHLIALYGSVAIAFLTIYQAPDRMQSLYWRSAMLPYLMPIVFLWLALAVIFTQEREQRGTAWRAPLAFFIALLVGGFSEAAAVFQMAGFLGLLAISVTLPKDRSGEGRRVSVPLVAATVGAMLAMAALLMSPFSQAVLPSESDRPSLVVLFLRSFRWSISFTWLTIRGLPLPTAITFLVGGLIGYWASPGFRIRGHGRRGWLLLAGAALLVVCVGVSLIASVYMAPYYARQQSPELRLQILGRHTTVLMFLGLGAVAGVALGTLASWRGLSPRLLAVGLVCVALLLSFYPLYASRETILRVPHHRDWASQWDARDAAIRRAVAAGEKDIHVVELDHIIPRVADLSPIPGSWYNQCAAGYYDALSIAADLPAR
jgi:hypothetical protein